VRLLLRISASLLCACATLLAEDSPTRPLDAFSYDQLRMFLKGYNGDWRPQSDREKGLPAPPATKSSPASPCQSQRLDLLISKPY